MFVNKKIKNTIISFGAALCFGVVGFCFLPTTNVYAQQLPQNYVFDIDNAGLVVGDQGANNTCWAYSCSKVLETLLFKRDGITVNISEDWISLAYMYYVQDEDQTKILTSDDGTQDKLDYHFGQTGIPQFFERVVNAYGIVQENDFQLTQSVDQSNFKSIFEESKSKAQSIGQISVSWAGYIKTAENQYYSTQDDIVGILKHRLYEHGAVYTAVNSLYISSATDFNYVYHNPQYLLNHGMTIIGYDDNFIISLAGNQKTGAFLLLNSQGDDFKYVYMPYEMFTPNMLQDPQTNTATDTNAVISNTYVINFAEDNSGDENGSNQEPQDPTLPPQDGEEQAPDEEDPPIIAPDGPTSGSDEILGGGQIEAPTFGDMIDKFAEKPISEKTIIVLSLLAVGVLIITGACLLGASIHRQVQTSNNNHQVLDENMRRFRMHQQNLQFEKAKLEEELEAMRKEAHRRKQRRLKREFKKKLENK